MIGWAALMQDGRCLREKDGLRWDEIDIHTIQKLWLETFESCALERSTYSRLLEFVQYKTGAVGVGGVTAFESQCVGWTDGVHEMIYRVSPGSRAVRIEIHPRNHFHPKSLHLRQEFSR